jgi:hypothetical protein
MLKLKGQQRRRERKKEIAAGKQASSMQGSSEEGKAIPCICEYNVPCMVQVLIQLFP